MRVLVINYEYAPLGGGASQQTKGICEGISEKGYYLDIVTMHYKGLPRITRKNNMTIYRVSAFRKHAGTSDTFEMFFYLVSAYAKCRQLIKKNKYDFVHAHFILPTGVLALLLKKQYGLRYLVSTHGSDVPGYNPDRFKLQHRLYSPIWKSIVKNAEFIASPSEFFKDMILKIYKADNIKVVGNGIYFKEIKQKKKEKIIIYTGRHFRRKGIQYLIRACSNLPKDWKLVITGEGNYTGQLKDLAKKTDANIEFPGWISREELTDLYRKSSILVLPSNEESFGLVIAEAMMHGNAVITTRGTACEEVAKGYGILVDKESAAQIRKALYSLIENPGKLKHYQNLAVKRAKEFSWPYIVNNYLEIYKKMQPLSFS